MKRPPRFSRSTPDHRRQALVDAAVRVLGERGAGGASVRAICAEAGVSPGLLVHYFDGVDALVVAAYEQVGALVAAALDRAMAKAGPDPRARLTAYVNASFASPIADPAMLATWLAFWSLVRSNPGVAALHGESYGGYRRVIEALIRDCTGSAADARLAAIGLSALVDGLWLELSLDPSSFTRAEACAIAERAVEAALSAPAR